MMYCIDHCITHYFNVLNPPWLLVESRKVLVHVLSACTRSLFVYKDCGRGGVSVHVQNTVHDPNNLLAV